MCPLPTQSQQIIDLFNRIELKSVMSSPAITIVIYESLQKAHDKFREKNIKHLIVVNREGRLCGLITLNDLFKITSPKKLSDNSWYYDPDTLDQHSLLKVMTEKPFSMKSYDKLLNAMEKMAKEGFGCIPVVDMEQHPIGIVTQTDMIRVVIDILKELPLLKGSRP